MNPYVVFLLYLLAILGFVAVTLLLNRLLGFYLRVIQYLFMSPQEQAADRGPSRGVALGAGLICLVPAILLAVLPGWVIARL